MVENTLEISSYLTSVEHFFIFFTYLSPYYILSVIVTIIAIGSVFWFQIMDNRFTSGDISASSEFHDGIPNQGTEDDFGKSRSKSEADCRDYLSDQSDDLYPFLHPMSRIKRARQAAIAESVTGNMSNEQLREEEEAEATQLAAIWDMLKTQKSQFNIGSEEELQEQLQLYRL